MTHKEYLIKAREVLVERGWCHAASYGRGPNGEVCALVALEDAVPSAALSGYDSMIWQIRTMFSQDLGVSSIADWNDDEKRTFQDVLDLYDRTIASLE